MPKLHFNLRLAASVALMAVLALPLAAQDSQSQASASDDQSTETLKINVDVVQLFFNVKDKHGALIPNLTKDNFEIIEDGKPQTIKYFKAESDLPLTLGILIDAAPEESTEQREDQFGHRRLCQSSWLRWRSHPLPFQRTAWDGSV